MDLNRRLSPEVYLGVVSIYRDSNGFSFIGGEVVEYAVQMRELPGGYFLNELVANGVVKEPEIDRIVRRLRRFYASEIPGPEIEKWGEAERLRISTNENFAQIEPFLGKTLSPVCLQTIRHFTDTFFAQNNRLFEKRIADRRIFDCHGDLRLDHINITPESVAIFDCIEFNDRLRFIDVANDLAFLAMDFDFAQRSDLGRLFLLKSAHALADNDILRLANFYKCYRAIVRGKVESIEAISQHVAHAEEHAERAKRYFRLALRYVVAGPFDMFLFIVMGGIGTGKTTIAKQLAWELGWPVFSSDRIRKKLAGTKPTERTTSNLREKLYSEAMTDLTYRTLIDEALSAACAQSGAVLDATFSKRAQRDFLRRECSRANLSFRFVELKASREEIEDRLARRAKTAGEISDARLEDLEILNAAYESPTKPETDVLTVSTVEPISESVKTLMTRLAEARQSHATEL